eukprot:3901240-Prymnesium_polylepis.1
MASPTPRMAGGQPALCQGRAADGGLPQRRPQEHGERQAGVQPQAAPGESLRYGGARWAWEGVRWAPPLIWRPP